MIRQPDWRDHVHPGFGVDNGRLPSSEGIHLLVAVAMIVAIAGSVILMGACGLLPGSAGMDSTMIGA